jgi:hypothetical protein
VQKTCRQCQATFEVTQNDLTFYDAISPTFAGTKYAIPPPSLCPDCRQQRRLAWRNERNLYSRSCSLCGKHMVSVYPQTVPFPVYCVPCWWSDKWDAATFGRTYDPSRPFLDQWAELHAVTPKLSMQNDDGIESENSEYCYDISRCKDCYRLIGSWYDRDCHYSLNVNHSKNVVDCNSVSHHSEIVYESLDSQKLYHCAWVQNCENCRDCFFCYDLKGCADCFGCVGLRQKTFCIFNEQLTEDSYRVRMREISLGSHAIVDQTKRRFDAWALRFPRLFANLQNCEDCEGNNLFNCKSVLGYSVFNAEYCKFVDRSDRPIHSYDLINNGGGQWCCDCVTPDDSYMTLFSIWCWKSKNILLSDNCHSSGQLLGCISLHRKKHCILNKEYPKEEYERLAGAIIESLRRDGAWGEHLPIRLSPFGYNESGAFDYYPLSKEETRARGWPWTDALPYTTGKETLLWDKIPDDIADVPDTVTKEILACSSCKKNFKITPKEFAFYRAFPSPLPRNCPECRYALRFKKKTPTRLWSRTCGKCGTEIRTTYSPDRPEIVYCEKCYLKEVY